MLNKKTNKIIQAFLEGLDRKDLKYLMAVLRVIECEAG
jgi:hypothetical protein